MDDDGNSHCVFIKDYNKLVALKLTIPDINFIIVVIVSMVSNESRFLENGCLAIDGQAVILPGKGERIKFSN